MRKLYVCGAALSRSKRRHPTRRTAMRRVSGRKAPPRTYSMQCPACRSWRVSRRKALAFAGLHTGVKAKGAAPGGAFCLFIRLHLAELRFRLRRGRVRLRLYGGGLACSAGDVESVCVTCVGAARKLPRQRKSPVRAGSKSLPAPWRRIQRVRVSRAQTRACCPTSAHPRNLPARAHSAARTSEHGAACL